MVLHYRPFLNSCYQEPQALYALVDVTHVVVCAYTYGGADNVAL